MGSYTGVHIRFKVKQTVEPELLHYLTKLFSKSNPSELGAIPLSFDNFTGLNIDVEARSPESISTELEYMTSCSSASFKNWKTRTSLKNLDGTHIFESFGSVKFDDPEVLVVFFDTIQEHLVIENGDILARFIYENSLSEEVVFYNKEAKGFQITKGYVHLTVHHNETLDSSTHPYNEKFGYEIFIPSMNIYELYPEHKDKVIITNKDNDFKKSGSLYVHPYRTVFLTHEELHQALVATSKLLTPPKKI